MVLERYVKSTTTTGFIDTSEIDNFENINFTVSAGTDVTLGGNANDTDGMDDAAAVTIAGGNELSTFTVSATDDWPVQRC